MVQSAYRESKKPHDVSMLEIRIDKAETYEEAFLQVAYQQVVETRKLRMVTTAVLGVLLAGVVLAIVLFLAASQAAAAV